MVSKTTRQLLDATYHSKLSTQNGTLLTGTFGQKVILTDTVTHGTNIPNWRRVIANGGNATTDLVGEKWHIENVRSDFTNRATHPTNPSQFSETRVVGYPLLADYLLPLQTMSTDNANNLALKRFYANLASVNSKFKGLVFAGELKQTLNAIRHPARSLRRGIDSYLKSLQKGARKARRDRVPFIRETWLEYSFGWKPVISDIDSAINAFYRSRQVRGLFEMISGDGVETEKGVVHGSILPTYSDFTVRFFLLNQKSVSVKYRGVTRSYGNGSADKHYYGFSPTEFVPTIWELIPYSFLVDYFTNIGDIISSWSYRFIQTDWCSKTTRDWVSSETRSPKLHYNINNGWKVSDSGQIGSMKVEHSKVSRARSVVLGLPKFQLQCPGMDSRWVNIVALTSLLGKSRRSLS